ncbi:MAG TPA: M20/M25/M40 family metallo-hydrolase [Rhodanobacteraceae bacterium]|nr:M20/M25/M40 family metallo-hydrolase [Rhodanobacteraceae bacterium]
MIKPCVLLLSLGLSGVAVAQSSTDLDMANKIRQESFHHSQVMKTLSHLTEVIGPRLTVSPQKYAANEWTAKQFKAWGLSHVHKEAFADFGRGWEFTNATVQEIAPRKMPLRALPKAWSPGTHGTVEGEVMKVSIESVDDLEQYKGKLAGKILLLDDARDYKRSDEPDSQRYSEAELAKLHDFEIPGDSKGRKDWTKRYAKYLKLRKAKAKFFADEGVLATISVSNRSDGILGVSGNGTRKAGDPVGVPALVMMSEHYNELVRDVENKRPVKLRINVAAHFTSDKNLPGYNVIAEIPGHGRHADEIVMLGAHMDSWHTGTGASDNGAGVAVMMEAMRILKAVGARPDRTIRVALWGGEEQGLIGSFAYVKQHFAAYPEPTDPEQKKLPDWLRKPTGKLQFKPEYKRLSAYFNLDNGSGRIRGIYAQENMAVMPIFKQWLKPFHDVGATEVVSGNTGSTDHISFDRVGLPGFQFVQDWLDYFPHVHHTNLDTLDHVSTTDLKQAAAVVAWFAYKAATRPDKLPRKPLMED